MGKNPPSVIRRVDDFVHVEIVLVQTRGLGHRFSLQPALGTVCTQLYPYTMSSAMPATITRMNSRSSCFTVTLLSCSRLEVAGPKGAWARSLHTGRTVVRVIAATVPLYRTTALARAQEPLGGYVADCKRAGSG
jgi:hypothetical protein